MTTCLLQHTCILFPNNSNTTTSSFRVISVEGLPRQFNTDLHRNTSCSSTDPIPFCAGTKMLDIHYDVINWGIVLSRVPVSMIIVDSKDPDFVHVRELGNHQDDHCKCVQEKHWILIVRRVRSYQVPARRVRKELWDYKVESMQFKFRILNYVWSQI